MDKEELYKLLKEHLKLESRYRWCGAQKILTIDLLFDDKKITGIDQTIEYDDEF